MHDLQRFLPLSIARRSSASSRRSERFGRHALAISRRAFSIESPSVPSSASPASM